MTSALYGDGEAEAARFRADVDLAADLLVADGHRVSDSSLAAALGADRATIAKYRAQFGVTIGEIRSAALRRRLTQRLGQAESGPLDEMTRTLQHISAAPQPASVAR